MVSTRNEKLENELNNYKNIQLRESIRMGYNDFAEHYASIGLLSHALKFYTSSRDYLTIPIHILEMCNNIIEISLEMDNYSNINTFILKANQVVASPEKQMYMNKFTAVSGLMHLKNSQFKQAALKFLEVPFDIAPKLWSFIAAKDIALYAGLTALASFDRNDLKSKILENQNFKNFLELEPQIRELIKAFYHSKFTNCFEIMANMQYDLTLDYFLSKHVSTLYTHIKNKAVLQYCSPFLSIDMHQMAKVFDTTVETLEEQVVSLITDNQLDARIDSQNKVIRANTTNERSQVYAQSLQLGKEFQQKTRFMLLRSKMIQSGIYLKADRK
ncbi:COP9 signalosome complex subunit 1 [Boothiomyces macroporosus]|uniref:COP9 signalosome complex subunit 1 n=1 Tax=Boothiomyces macroporosus TaxID=261099 RepID=A0AAD5Y4X5_9FUNG|nr:COP9 signalosome complex subunit 1 [Boothiomyces macroporosus]KAJ3259158.1 COP9 signalosome complex subunit 1 [Boothiomyces macroporosus]